MQQAQLLSVPDRTGFDLKFSLFGIPTRIHPLFWVMALLLGYRNPDIPKIVISIACIFVSILVHEFGHALANKYYGHKDCSVVLYLMGGLCVPGPSGSPSRFPFISMVFWGPLAGFILGGIAYGCAMAFQNGLLPDPHENVKHALSVLMWVNFVWGLINLLPVVPLDGGLITWEILKMKRPIGADVSAFTVSMIAAALVAVGFLAWGIAEKKPTAHLLPMLMFGFFAFQSFQVRKQLKEMGGSFYRQEPEHREAWEQDPDWWKK